MTKEIWKDDYYVYDVEIANEVKSVPGGWDNPEAMGFGSGVVYGKMENRYWFFLHDEGKEAMIRLLNGKHVVSFNGIKFDSRVVLGNDRGLFPGEAMVMNGGRAWANYDILAEYVASRFNLKDVGEAEKKLGDRAIHDGTFNLDALCKATLRMAKSGHGADAPILYQKGQFAELLQYNLHDVRITRNLYEHILKYGYVADGSLRVVYLFQPWDQVRWIPIRP